MTRGLIYHVSRTGEALGHPLDAKDLLPFGDGIPQDPTGVAFDPNASAFSETDVGVGEEVAAFLLRGTRLMVDRGSFVDGSVALGRRTSGLLRGATIAGDALLGPRAGFRIISPGVLGGQVVCAPGLGVEAARVRRLLNRIRRLPAQGVLDPPATVRGATVVTGRAGLNVVDLRRQALNGETLTLDSPPGATRVLNVASGAWLTNGASIEASGGLLINVYAGAALVAGGSTVPGTVAAAHRVRVTGHSQVLGQVLSRERIVISGGSTVAPVD